MDGATSGMMQISAWPQCASDPFRFGIMFFDADGDCIESWLSPCDHLGTGAGVNVSLGGPDAPVCSFCLTPWVKDWPAE